jgi:hypothetical protein
LGDEEGATFPSPQNTTSVPPTAGRFSFSSLTPIDNIDIVIYTLLIDKKVENERRAQMKRVLAVFFVICSIAGCERRVINDCPKDWCSQKFCASEVNLAVRDCNLDKEKQLEVTKKQAEDKCAQALESLTNIAKEKRISCGDYNFSWCAEYECGLPATPGRLFVNDLSDDELLRAKYIKVKDYLICDGSFENYLKCATEFTPDTHKPLITPIEAVQKKQTCYRDEYKTAALEVMRRKKPLGLFAFSTDDDIFSPRIYAVIDYFSYLRENDIDPKSVGTSIQELVESFRSAFGELERAWKKETDKDMRDFLKVRLCDIVSDHEYFDLPSPKAGKTKQQVQENFGCDPPETSLFGSRIG